VQVLTLVMDGDGATGAVGNFHWIAVRALATETIPRHELD